MKGKKKENEWKEKLDFRKTSKETGSRKIGNEGFFFLNYNAQNIFFWDGETF